MAMHFRNRRGEHVDLRAFTASEAKQEFGRVLDAAARDGAVTITRHDQPRAVLLAIDEFEALVAGGARTLDALSAEFDGLLETMQTSKARKGMAAAFAASPAQLGRAAVAAARKRG